jgi:TRAP-type C4-dicarboxylate transport system substrate-binding protein
VDSWQKVDWIRAHLREPLRTSLTSEGYELLAFEDEGCERIMTRGHAVRRPLDLAKVRMAALDSDPVAPLIASVVPGILSIPLPSSEVVDAVAAGPRLGVSAVVGTAVDAERYQWTKVIDGITRMPVLCASGALVLRSGAYEKLAADERQAVDEASLRFEEILAPHLRKEDTAASLRLLRALNATESSVDDRAAWQRAFRHAAEQTDGSLPKAMVTQVLALSREIDALH